MKNIFIFIIFFCFTDLVASAQTEILEIHAQVLSGFDKPISGANIINMKKRTAISANSQGIFFITIHKYDVLRISAIGYQEKYIDFKDSVIVPGKLIKIRLKQKLYNIATVNIFDARWEDFKFDFEQKGLEENPAKDKITERILSYIDPYELEARKTPMPAGFGISIPLNFKSKQDKQRKKVTEYERRDALQKLVEEKYNKDIVSKITGLKNKELSDFIRFCQIDNKYILRSNDYDIIVRIKALYYVYKAGNKF